MNRRQNVGKIDDVVSQYSSSLIHADSIAGHEEEWMDAVSLPVHLSMHKRWHPKLNVYRLLVIVSTAGIGCAKTVVSVRGSTIVPTTLEWIGGVVIFMILDILSTYDCSKPPPKIAWLYECDCLDVVWAILHIQKPIYLSNQVVPKPLYDSRGRPTLPFFTAYRLLVSLSIAGFGLAKAALGYLGYSTAASWVDWVIGVVLGLGLYVLGLYEFNSIGMWAGLFVTDRGPFISGVRKFLMTTSLASFAVGWIVTWFWCLDAFIHSDNTISTPGDMAATRIDGLHNFCVKLTGSIFLIACSGSGIACLAMLYNSVRKEVRWFITLSRKVALTAWRRAGTTPILKYLLLGLEGLACLVIPELKKTMSRVGSAVNNVDSRRHQALAVRLIIRTVLHIIAILLVLVISFTFFGFGYRYYFLIPSDENYLATIIMLWIGRHFFLLFGSFLMLSGFVVCFDMYKSMVGPYKRPKKEGYTISVERELNKTFIW